MLNDELGVMGCIDPEWNAILDDCVSQMDVAYLRALKTEEAVWLPGLKRLFAAFSLPLSHTHYLLLGESPYPRIHSANGYAFWDAAVSDLWSAKGLSKAVNRATSFRNWIKLLLHARGDLKCDFSQEAIAVLDKSDLIQTAQDFFQGLIKRGFLLLNASLVYSKGEVNAHARQWRPFISRLFKLIELQKPNVKMILFGRIADEVPKSKLEVSLQCEHPYNLSFITNPKVVNFFGPMDLLYAKNNT